MLDLSKYTVIDLKGQILRDQVMRGETGKAFVNGTFVALSVSNCSDLLFDGVTIVGDDSGIPVPQIRKKGVSIRDSQRIVFRNGDISRAFVGIDLYNGTDCLIEKNEFHDNRDNVHGVNAHGAIVRKNIFRDHRNAISDHPDDMQFFASPAGGVTRNVTIEDNLCYRGIGNASQGIFLQHKYENLRVAGNTVIGALKNGIRVDEVLSGAVIDNQVIMYAGEKSAINVFGALTLSGNKAPIYEIKSVFQRQSPAGNYPNSPIAPADEAALVAAWRQGVIPAPAPHVPTPARPGWLNDADLAWLDARYKT